MTVLPAGTYRRGSPPDEAGRAPHEGPVREILFDAPFALSVAEVTRGQFLRFVEETGYPAPESCWAFDGRTWSQETGFGWSDPGFPQTDDHPAVCISRADAEAYARWVGRRAGVRYRLPSETEWEYAARAGARTRFPHGDDPDYLQLCQHGNGAAGESGFEYRNTACRDDYAYTAPVDAYPANAFGLHGMLGNALEWTADCYHPDYSEAPTDGTPYLGQTCPYTVLRGGNWAGAPQHMRPANRGANSPGARWSTNGFRLARDLP